MSGILFFIFASCHPLIHRYNTRMWDIIKGSKVSTTDIFFAFFQKPTDDQIKFWTDIRAYDYMLGNTNRTHYDSIMLMALALNKSIKDLQSLDLPRRLEDFSYRDSDIAGIFNYNVRHMVFTGISVSCNQFKATVWVLKDSSSLPCLVQRLT